MPTPRSRALQLALLPLLLPPLVCYFWICLDRNAGGLILPAGRAEWTDLLNSVPRPTAKAAAIFLGWFLFQALLERFLPGKIREGTPLADGRRLPYRMNGWVSWWTTWGCLLAAVAWGGVRPTVLAEQSGSLLAVATLFAFALSVYLWIDGRRNPEGAPEGFVSDFVLGSRLNPRIGTFDWKLFCETRPGLIGWIALDLSFAARQLEIHGRLTTPMILVVLFQFFYVADCFFHEEAILTTWDVKHEKFGWMLCFGDLVWVPFVYTIQAHYLVRHPFEPGWPALSALIALNMAGYLLFRGANLQKHRFRGNPDSPVWGRPPEVIRTAKGSLLLTSGYWGLARHVNYLGDLLMGLAWCLLTGFAHPLPYFYILYFTALLVHRERRDHAQCAEKYGDDWKAYCRKVRWRIVPWIY